MTKLIGFANDNTSIEGLQPEMRPALIIAKAVYDTLETPLIITAGLDGAHSAGSLHYYGYALDLRTKNLPDETSREQAASMIGDALDKLQVEHDMGGNYWVGYEKTHIHIQFKPDSWMAADRAAKVVAQTIKE